MSTNETVQALLAAAQDLANRAVSDNELAERLVVNANETIAEAAGHPIPAGVIMTARRNAEGVVEISGQADPTFEGELNDAALEDVAGGVTAAGVAVGAAARLPPIELALGGALVGIAIGPVLRTSDLVLRR